MTQKEITEKFAPYGISIVVNKHLALNTLRLLHRAISLKLGTAYLKLGNHAQLVCL